jgi:LDH2 family malate/lactate/ureidoglycolate dehydrogenase
MAAYSAQQLTDFAQRILEKLGAAPDDARLAASLLIRSDVRGYPTHGIGILTEYVQRAKAGTVHLDARPSVIHDGKATAQVDGALYLGQVVGTQAMGLAIEKARAHGLGAVGARNCAHFGRLADYVEQAAEAGMVGMAFVTVGGASLATFGSREPTGNSNPIAFGIPGPNDEHLVFDFTTAVMSMREIARRGAQGEPIPEGIVLDSAGNPTTDFAAYSGPPRGVALPFGGHKGSGLHMVAEILAGVLTGHGTGLSWAPKGGPAVNGGMFVALDVTEFMPRVQFEEEVGNLATFMRSRKPQAGIDAVRLPGDGARARAKEREASGIPIPDALLESLNAAADDLGVARL